LGDLQRQTLTPAIAGTIPLASYLEHGNLMFAKDLIDFLAAKNLVFIINPKNFIGIRN
jgi:hypothetical protein